MEEKVNDIEQPTINIKRFIKLLNFGKLNKIVFVIAFIFGFIETLAGLVVPLFTRNIIDLLSTGGIEWSYILFLVGAFIAQGIAGGISFYLMTYAGESIVSFLRNRLWSHVLQIPVSYFDEHESGETMSRITQDTNIIKTLVTNHLVSFISGMTGIIGSILLLVMIDWKFTLFIFISIPVAIVIIFPLGKLMYKISKRTQDELASFSSHLGRVLNEIRLVKSHNAQEYEKEIGRKEINRLMNYGLKEAKINAVISPVMTAIMMAIVVAIIGYGGARVASGSLSPGSLVAIIIYIFNIVLPFSQMATFFTTFQKALGATERIFHILELEKEHSGHVTEIDLMNPLSFHHVSFSYDGRQNILKDVSFTIEQGKTYALVGPSGGGKTTIFSLIERFYVPQEGEIKLGETNIQDFHLASWRAQIGYVSQEISVLSATVRENICYGLEGPVDEERIKEAARLANAFEFIEKLPDGFETHVGERGIKLSGGQRQRLAIARAVLRNQKILLLDEATSNLDSESEQYVQQAIRNLMKDRTTIIIAHRLSTVVDADEIFVIEKGRITGRGTHDQLLATHPLYQKLVKHQFHSHEVHS
ncbi:ABC transporter ATP-binding protein [Fervidibacillus halotolerans]|uniref:ABC transporter ATP-binding protein/permease n=1 Tax=Fervidibacillus halotolerans TaxID=2980027 RepID=A0A9E8M2V5_9BACI|nr:ABC transporter ATP-binding protein [Fervidibacillus halotolerans]WAA13404.1 ABC transporter ATP-binding protein/permease [Fervidibacillus halotolerans]